MLELRIHPLTLELKSPFCVSHGVSNFRHNLLVELHDSLTGYTGRGEVACVPYYGIRAETLRLALEELPRPFPDFTEPAEALSQLPPLPAAARSGVDCAVHELWAQRLGLPLWESLHLPPQQPYTTANTISLDHPKTMAAQARELNPSILKLKLDANDPIARIDAVREAASAELWVDVNCGWTLAQSLRWLPELESRKIRLLEQPLPKNASPKDWLRLKSTLDDGNYALRLFADESICSLEDLASIGHGLHGVVVKLAKCGGLADTLSLIHAARTAGLEIMLSSMLESSLGIRAAETLAPLCDFHDLDAPLFLKNDPVQSPAGTHPL